MRGDMQFAALNGYVIPPMWIAMFAQRHKHVYGTTDEDFGQIAITFRRHAAANPHAMQRQPIDMDGYLSARWMREPFRLYDCCLETDGAVALVVTTLDRARDLRQVPVRMAGFGEGHTHGGSWTNFPDLSEMYSAYAARRLWASTGLRPADIDVACLYDCFTGTVMATFEDFGFCPKGQTGAFFADGRATYGGDVVVNPHGGLLSEGYLHGLNYHFEAVRQLRGDAGDRQVAGARHALVTAGAGPAGGALIDEASAVSGRSRCRRRLSRSSTPTAPGSGRRPARDGSRCAGAPDAAPGWPGRWNAATAAPRRPPLPLWPGPARSTATSSSTTPACRPSPTWCPMSSPSLSSTRGRGCPASCPASAAPGSRSASGCGPI